MILFLRMAKAGSDSIASKACGNRPVIDQRHMVGSYLGGSKIGMRIDKIWLESFRGFDSLEMHFDPHVTALVGINGAGKTTVLEAVSVLLSRLHASVTTRPGKGPRFEDRDVQNGRDYTECSIAAHVCGQDARWTAVHTRRGYPVVRSSYSGDLKSVVDQVQATNAKGQWALPLAVKYPVTRAAIEIPQRIKDHTEFSPLSAYDGALSGAGASFRQFFRWFREREDVENERRLREGTGTDPLLNAVRRAVTQLLPEFTDLHVQRIPHRMMVLKNGKPFELNQLSDGERVLIALAGDLARRLALANPTASDPLACSAVVIIDEIELHLHPGWQREVVERLHKTFPRCQFIITTHSPQVLAAIPSHCVRVLSSFKLVAPSAATEGRDSNSILAEIMGTGERPEQAKRQIDQISKLIESGHFTDARQKLAALAEKWSESEPEVVRLRTLIEFLEGSDAVDPEKQ